MGFQYPVTKSAGRLGKVVVFRLAPGCDIKKSIEEISIDECISAGVILGGAASLKKAVFRNPKGFFKFPPITDEFRTYTTKEEAMELLTISGNISRKDSKPFIHAHITISTENGLAYGGHLEDGCIVYTTGEIIIAELEGIAMLRLHNEETKNIELCPVNKGKTQS